MTVFGIKHMLSATTIVEKKEMKEDGDITITHLYHRDAAAHGTDNAEEFLYASVLAPVHLMFALSNHLASCCELDLVRYSRSSGGGGERV